MASSAVGRVPVFLVGALIVLGAWLLTFARTVDRDLNHDEHQFLAPAALVSREGLAPWRDFPLYHLPNLVYAYAAADWLSGDLVLGAKLVNFAATASVIAAIVAISLRRRGWGGICIALTAVLLLLSDPLFRYTAGKTWNHEVPTALLLAAGGLLLQALRRDTLWLTVAAGLCGGVAAGCRLTFAPTLLGLFVFVLLFPLTWRRRLSHAAALTLSATLALSPTLYFLATEPNRFIFSNFEFPRLRLLDPENTRIQKTTSIWRKTRFFIKEIMLPSWPVFLLWFAVVARPGWQWLRTRTGNSVAGLWVVLTPFVLVGCFSPSRYQLQHYFVFIPMLVVAVVCSAVKITQITRIKWLMIVSAMLVSVIMAGRAARDYGVVEQLAQREEWFSSRLSRQAGEIRAAVPNGRILTLAPTIPLATRLRIYPEFATGTFGWRSASLVAGEKRDAFHLVAPEDLAEFLRSQPPAAVLTGVEKDEDEAPLVEWAKSNGFQPQALKKKRTLWLPPARF